MISYKKYIPGLSVLFLLVILLITISCEEEIPYNPGDQEYELLVVEGRITNELKRHSIRLTKTANYFYNDTVPSISDAEVYIIEESSETRYDLTLENERLGYYLTDFISGNIGELYSLHINYEGESYKATAFLDTVALLDSINYEYEFDSYQARGYYNLRISAYEPPPLGDIYMFLIYINDTLFNDELIKTPYSDDQTGNDSYLANIEIMSLAQEEIISDSNHFIIKMLSISLEEFFYNNAFVQETYFSGSIFSGPSANIPSNVKCMTCDIDGLGFFGASAVTVQEMMLVKEHSDSTNNPDYKL